jgi:NAD(P)-dependent dehydrogenase (short-subunit alcohol dehydrogenase family)
VQFMHAVVPAMAERGWGRVVNIATVAAKYPAQIRILSGAHLLVSLAILMTWVHLLHCSAVSLPTRPAVRVWFSKVYRQYNILAFGLLARRLNWSSMLKQHRLPAAIQHGETR